MTNSYGGILMHTDTGSPNHASLDFHLRVSTFGLFRIEWVHPLTGQIVSLPAKRLHGQNAANALGLFKALLSCPDRFASRSWLLEQFWPASKSRSPQARLNDVASALRGLLRPEQSNAMILHFVHGGPQSEGGYRLDGCPQIWCDADAFEWYVKHGMLLDRQGQDSTVCWERAYILAERGVYLSEHPYDEWCKQRRATLEGCVRDCVQHWGHLLRQAGHVDEAIIRIRMYWQKHPTDEDTLRPLLEMLGERGRFQEAEAYFAQAQAALQADGYQLDPHTQEVIEVVRARHISHRFQSIPEASLPSSAREACLLSGGQKDAFDDDPSVPVSDPLHMELFHQFSAMLGHSGALDTMKLELLEQRTNMLWQQREVLEKPLETLYREVIDHFLHFKVLLSASLLPAERIRLCDLASRTLLLAGVILYDKGAYAHARDVMQIAIQAAVEAENVFLQGLIKELLRHSTLVSSRSIRWPEGN